MADDLPMIDCSGMDLSFAPFHFFFASYCSIVIGFVHNFHTSLCTWCPDC